MLYHGKPLDGLKPGVAIVFQSFALYPWMTVTENVEVVLQAAALPPEERKERAEHAIRIGRPGRLRGGLSARASGGMKQRVGMARALSVDPEILFMDEPFSHVDALTAEGLRAEVIDLWAAAGPNPSSILMVSHDIKEVVYMADRIVVLSAIPGACARSSRTPCRGRATTARARSRSSSIYCTRSSPATRCPTCRPAARAGRASSRCRAPTTSEIVGLLEYLDAHGGVGRHLHARRGDRSRVRPHDGDRQGGGDAQLRRHAEAGRSF